MRIDGHGLRDHLRLLSPLFGLIAGVWALRLIMNLAGTPAMLVRMVSVGVAGAVSVLVAVFLIHFKRFGSYASVVVASFVLIAWEQILIVLAISVTLLSGKLNVYTEPAYTFGESHAQHIAAHLTYGLGVESIFGAAMGCLVLWMLRRLVPSKEASPSGKPVL